MDKEASQISKKLSDEEKGIVRTAISRGNMAMEEIANINEEYDETCNYCKEADSTVNHIGWQCSYFKPHRIELDKELAAVPHHLLPRCVQCGMSPAMNIEGQKTYWGVDLR